MPPEVKLLDRPVPTLGTLPKETRQNVIDAADETHRIVREPKADIDRAKLGEISKKLLDVLLEGVDQGVEVTQDGRFHSNPRVVFSNGRELPLTWGNAFKRLEYSILEGADHGRDESDTQDRQPARLEVWATAESSLKAQLITKYEDLAQVKEIKPEDPNNKEQVLRMERIKHKIKIGVAEKAAIAAEHLATHVSSKVVQDKGIDTRALELIKDLYDNGAVTVQFMRVNGKAKEDYSNGKECLVIEVPAEGKLATLIIEPSTELFHLHNSHDWDEPALDPVDQPLVFEEKREQEAKPQNPPAPPYWHEK